MTQPQFGYLSPRAKITAVRVDIVFRVSSHAKKPNDYVAGIRGRVDEAHTMPDTHPRNRDPVHVAALATLDGRVSRLVLSAETWVVGRPPTLVLARVSAARTWALRVPAVRRAEFLAAVLAWVSACDAAEASGRRGRGAPPESFVRGPR